MRYSTVITRLFFFSLHLCVSVGISVLMLFLFGKPYKRGFFCNDESLYHPYHDSTVTSPMLYVIGLFLPICTVSQPSIVIVIYALMCRDSCEKSSDAIYRYSEVLSPSMRVLLTCVTRLCNV